MKINNFSGPPSKFFLIEEGLIGIVLKDQLKSLINQFLTIFKSPLHLETLKFLQQVDRPLSLGTKKLDGTLQENFAFVSM